jgi:two-component system LytT family response regulator
MNAYLIDDEADSLEVLTLLLKKYCPEIDILGKNNDPLIALADVKKLKPDVVFLDIQMPVLNGLELAEQIQYETSEIIFTTAFDQYAISAIRFSALDYLLKPVDPVELKQAIQRAHSRRQHTGENAALQEMLLNIKLLKGPKPKIAIASREELEFVPIEEILRCEAEANYTHIFLLSGRKMLASKTLKEFEILLEEFHFIRIHQSHLINKAFVRKLLKNDGGYVVMENGDQLPISRTRKDDVMEKLFN